MLSEKEETALSVENVMKEIYQHIGIPYHTYVTTINNQGVTVIP
jgi:homoserine kinase